MTVLYVYPSRRLSGGCSRAPRAVNLNGFTIIYEREMQALADSTRRLGGAALRGGGTVVAACVAGIVTMPRRRQAI